MTELIADLALNTNLPWKAAYRTNDGVEKNQAEASKTEHLN